MDKHSPDSNRNRFFFDLPKTARRQKDWAYWAKLIGKQPVAAAARPADLAPALSAPSVTTDQVDYSPGETALITATGFTPGATITFAIADDPQDPGDDSDVVSRHRKLDQRRHQK